MNHLLMRRVRLLTTSAAIAVLLAAAPQAYAETPKDTLVLAWAIDDIITLDPDRKSTRLNSSH